MLCGNGRRDTRNTTHSTHKINRKETEYLFHNNISAGSSFEISFIALHNKQINPCAEIAVFNGTIMYQMLGIIYGYRKTIPQECNLRLHRSQRVILHLHTDDL